MRRSTVIAAAFLALLLFGGGTLLAVRDGISGAVGGVVRAPVSFLASVATAYRRSDEFEALEVENQALRAQLLFVGEQPRATTLGAGRAISARVYSTYPFSNRGLLTVSAGSRAGVAAGMPVLHRGMLLGKVTAVEDSRSTVQTVFDSGWQLPVKLGAAGVDGLLIGGREPRVTLIADARAVAPGDPVLSASADVPYGLTVAAIARVESGLGSDLAQATLTFDYDAREVARVDILAP